MGKEKLNQTDEEKKKIKRELKRQRRIHKGKNKELLNAKRKEEAEKKR